MRPPKNRKPVAVKATGSQCSIKAVRAFDNPEESTKRLDLQAKRIAARFAVSWPLARCVAELAYAGGRA